MGFRESDVAKSGLGVPQLDRPILPPRRDDDTVGRVSQTPHPVRVPALLEDVLLGPPFPDEELLGLGTAEGQPLGRGVDGDRPDRGVGERQGVNVRQRRKLVQTEEPGGKADHQKRMRGRVGRGDHVLRRGVGVEVMTGGGAPATFDDRMGLIDASLARLFRGRRRRGPATTSGEEIDRIISQSSQADLSSIGGGGGIFLHLPAALSRADHPILTHGVTPSHQLPRQRAASVPDAAAEELIPLRQSPARVLEMHPHQRSLVPDESPRLVIPDGIDGPNSRLAILTPRQQHRRIARPIEGRDVPDQSGVLPVQDHGCEFPPQARRQPHLYEITVTRCEFRPVGAESQFAHRPLEFEPVEYDPAVVIHEHPVGVDVHDDQQSIVVGGEGDASDVRACLDGQSAAAVMQEVQHLHAVAHGGQDAVAVAREDDVRPLRRGREDVRAGGGGRAVRGAAQPMQFVIELHDGVFDVLFMSALSSTLLLYHPR